MNRAMELCQNKNIRGNLIEKSLIYWEMVNLCAVKMSRALEQLTLYKYHK
jgi:hypothetical protein